MSRWEPRWRSRRDGYRRFSATRRIVRRMAEYFAGVDAGGSRSEIVVVDSALAERARVNGPPAAVRPDNVSTVAKIISDGLRGYAPVQGLVVGAAGAGRPRERQALEAALRGLGAAQRIKVVGDGE